MPDQIQGADQNMWVIDGSGAGLVTGSMRAMGQSGGTLYTLLTKTDGTLVTESTVTTGSEAFNHGKSGTSWFPLKVESDGTLVTSASVTTGSEAFNHGKSGTSWFPFKVEGDGTLVTTASVTTGSESFIYGKSGTNWIAAKVTSDGKLETTATSTSPTASAEGTPVPGSVNMLGAEYLGSTVSLMATAGSELITTGSVYQATDPWIVLGSINIDNASTVGSIQNQKSTITAGSVEAYQSTAADLKATVTQDSTIRQVSAGSTIVTNTVAVSGADVGFSDKSGNSLYLIGGNVPVDIQDSTVAVTQSTDPWITLGSVNVNNTVRQVSAGSVIITNTPAVTNTGSVAITNIPSVNQGTDPWIVLGSQQVTNFPASQTVDQSTAANLKTQIFGVSGGTTYPLLTKTDGTLVTEATVNAGSESYNFIKSGTGWLEEQQYRDVVISGIPSVIGSVAITNTPTVSQSSTVRQVSAGSVIITNIPSVNQGTDPWIVLGSQAVTQSTPSSLKTQIYGASGGTTYPLLTKTDGTLVTEATVTTGSESYNFVKSGTGWIEEPQYRSVVVSGIPSIIGSVAITNTPTVVQSSTLRQVSAGSIIITNTPSVNQGTDPWITLGSVNVNNTVRQVSAGSVIITNTPSVDAGSERFVYGKSGTAWQALKVEGDGTLVTSASVTTGSESYNYVKSGTGWIVEPEFRDVIISGTLSVNQGTDPWITLGSVNVNNTVTVDQSSTIRQISAGSVIITNSPSLTGSLEVFQTTNADMQVQATQETSPWIVLGSVNVDNFNDLGSSRVIENFSALGSARVITAGSVEVYGTKTLTTAQDRGVFRFSGATFTASGTAKNIIIPGTGSSIFLKGFNASAETPTKFRLLFSGGALIGTYNLPASGTVAMNMMGMEASGAANEPIAVGLFNAGSLHLTAYGMDST